jgi:hypothetical protein
MFANALIAISKDRKKMINRFQSRLLQVKNETKNCWSEKYASNKKQTMNFREEKMRAKQTQTVETSISEILFRLKTMNSHHVANDLLVKF